MPMTALRCVFAGVLLCTLFVSTSASALVASRSRTQTVLYTTGNVSLDGYEHMAIDIEYQFHACSGAVSITARALPETRRAVGPRGLVYWFEGVAYPVPSDVQLPSFTVSSPRGTVLYGGTTIGHFGADIGRTRQSPSCLTGWNVGNVPAEIQTSKSEKELQDFIDRIDIRFELLDYPMKNLSFESHLRNEARKAKAEAERKAKEEEQARANEDAKAKEEAKAREEAADRKALEEELARTQTASAAQQAATGEVGSARQTPQTRAEATKQAAAQAERERQAALERQGEEARAKFLAEKERQYEEGQRRAREESEATGKMVEEIATAAAPVVHEAVGAADAINQAAPMFVDVEIAPRLVTNYKTTTAGWGLSLRGPGMFNVIMGFSQWTSPAFSKQVRTPGLVSQTSGDYQFRIFDDARVSVNAVEIGVGFTLPGLPGEPRHPLSFRVIEGGVQAAFHSSPAVYDYVPETSGVSLGFFAGTGITYRLPNTGLALGFTYRIHSGVWPEYPGIPLGHGESWVVLPEGDAILSSLVLSAIWRFDIN